MSRRISKMFRSAQHDNTGNCHSKLEPKNLSKGPGFCAYQPRQAGIRSVSFIAVLFAASCQRCQVTAPDMPAQPGR